MSKTLVVDTNKVQKIAGKNVLVYINYGEGATYDAPKWCLIGGQTTADLDMTADSIDASTKDSGGWGETLAGMKSTELDLEGVAAVNDEGLDQLKQAYLNGLTVDICRYTVGAGTADRNFYVVTEYSDSTPHDDVVSYKAKLSGKGAPKFYKDLQSVDDVEASATPEVSE